MDNNYLFFWGVNDKKPFSNWYLADFKANGRQFNCVEQYMMWSKAMLFEDVEVANKILKISNPYQQKKLGRTVKNFDITIWEHYAQSIVYHGVKSRFLQNFKDMALLLMTQGKTLVEASPYDTVWGIGMTADNPKALNKATWNGTNWLGEVLTKFRDDYKIESADNNYDYTRCKWDSTNRWPLVFEF